MKRRHNARRTDPGTSHNAGRANRGSRQSHQRMMLEAFAGAGAAGFTDHEAAVRAELNQPGVCWWHRASDLRALGLIEWKSGQHPGTRLTVPGPNGIAVGVSVITKAGRESLRRAAA